MITIKHINSQYSIHYEYIETLLTNVFPINERRDLQLQRDYTNENNRFYANAILKDNIPVGLLTYWDFDKFVFIEHFTVEPQKRNSGIGHTIINILKAKLQRPLVLEVELPVDIETQRRIDFYTKLGFNTLKHNYLQPPYRAGDKPIPMHLMADGDPDINMEEFEKIKTTLYREVYSIT